MGEEKTAPKTKRQPSGAFMKPVKPDEKLAQIIGDQPLARTEVTRKLWDYIRGHNLQDPENKTFIKADDKLREIFDGKDRVSMFEMTRLVFNHVHSP
jgi:upstream activation factor subunit UAF30